MKDDASTSSYNHHGAHLNPCLLISPSCSENEEIEENHLGCEDHDDQEHGVKFQVRNSLLNITLFYELSY